MNNDKAWTLLQYIKRINCLTVLRDITEQTAFKSLHSMLTAILNDDAVSAEKHYHRLTQQLILSNPRRISGNIFKDYIIEWIVEHESIFAKQAAEGRADTVTSAAMQADIRSLMDIASLTTNEIMNFIDSTANSNDRISAISSAVWAGRNISGASGNDTAAVPDCSLMPWTYSETDMGEAYVCDPFITNIYDSLISGDMSGITDELWSFFNTCGTGVFLKNRFFISDSDNLLRPISESMLERDLLPFMYADEYAKLTENLADFSNDKNAENTVVCGAHGSGKTTMLLSLADITSNVTYIYISAHSMPNMTELFDRLKQEPLRFLLIIDDAQKYEELSRFVGTFLQPANVLIFAAATDDEQTHMFDSVIKLPSPDPAALTKYICDISFNKASADAVRNVCMDYQIETKRPLAYSAVKEILRRL